MATASFEIHRSIKLLSDVRLLCVSGVINDVMSSTTKKLGQWAWSVDTLVIRGNGSYRPRSSTTYEYDRLPPRHTGRQAGNKGKRCEVMAAVMIVWRQPSVDLPL